VARLAGGYRTLVADRSVAPEVRAEFGNVLLAANMPDDAIDAFSQVPPGAAERLDALLGLTKAHIALAQPTQALAAADQALARAPHDERVLVDRGVALDSLGRHAEAPASYRAALAAAPPSRPATISPCRSPSPGSTTRLSRCSHRWRAPRRRRRASGRTWRWSTA
jgi:Flp pilus assembly protein TadD